MSHTCLIQKVTGHLTKTLESKDSTTLTTHNGSKRTGPDPSTLTRGPVPNTLHKVGKYHVSG